MGFKKECQKAKCGLYSAAGKLELVDSCIEHVGRLTTFFCCREVALDAAEDSSLSKFHSLFVYNKENPNTTRSVCAFLLKVFCKMSRRKSTYVGYKFEQCDGPAQD